KSLGAIADRDGSFNISIPEEHIDGDTIYLTHLGYITLPVSCQKAINMVEFEMKPASYALPEIEIRVPEREKNWKDVFVQAVQEYQSRRRKRPFIALGQYVEEANYRDTPIMYMESLGY